mmetsp:Transcript_54301/g.116627  ORF Transcript_54301/g.116627 Transcript_54301/m.116627 type:complete len:95 (+) Transcript_54301:53-337(+)
MFAASKPQGKVLSTERVLTRVAGLLLLVLAGVFAQMAPKGRGVAFSSMEFTTQEITLGRDTGIGATGGVIVAIVVVSVAILVDMTREKSTVKQQ